MPKRGENIYRRKDGRWEGRVKLPDSQKKKSFYGHSYREVKEKISQYKQSPVPTKPQNDVFYQILDEWLKQKQTMVKISNSIESSVNYWK